MIMSHAIVAGIHSKEKQFITNFNGNFSLCFMSKMCMHNIFSKNKDLSKTQAFLFVANMKNKK